MRHFSLRLRLTLLISLMIFIAWLVTSAVTFLQIRHGLQEVLDSQQLLFAKRLASPDLQNLIVEKKWTKLPEIKSRNLKQLSFDDDALAFAIFNLQGDMLLNDGDNGQKFTYNAEIISSKDGVLLTNTKEWRILWLRSVDGSFIVAVGQELDYRRDLSEQLLVGQMIPWVVVLPILMLMIVIMISRELKPLKQVATELRLRQPDDATELLSQGAPKEVLPFIEALNSLFLRISGMLIKERRFISDAAHELRTPLSALKVQTEVVQLSEDDPDSRKQALNNLMIGIDRASRLVDQLLTLSRLDSVAKLTDIESVAWPELITSVIKDVNYQAQQHNATIEFKQVTVADDYQGNGLLLSLMLRNILDNALRYSNQGSIIEMTLYHDKLVVEDDGPGVSHELFYRLGERFFRPPGQDQIGSGLGLSIVKQIAGYHGIKVFFYNRPQGGFGVEMSW